MPHDRNGETIKTNDFVRVLKSNLGVDGEGQIGRVLTIHPGTDRCDLEVSVPVRSGPGASASAIIRMQTETASDVELVTGAP